MVKPTPITKAELQNNYREMAVNKMVNDAFSKSIYTEAMTHLEDYHKELSATQQ
jgi:hypothetical protein